MPHTHPELLAPAGDWDALRAAVAAGADAVYFGLSDFNARHRAANFTTDELPDVVGHLHDHLVRGYITVNTLIFSEELDDIARLIVAIAEAGTDAVIVQDLGLAGLVRRIAPTLAVHGSTQMTLTEPRGIELVRQLGVQRVILARELSLVEVGQIRARTTMPLEVFVHGALCVSYSGQCLTSESFGGRSANRGKCAQACRQPYQLIVDGQQVDVEEGQYLLSPKDLASVDLVNEALESGVGCLKIEGRLKSAQYVVAATGAYREALDAALAGRRYELSAARQEELQQSFSRGFAPGFLAGIDHQALVEGRSPKHRGVQAGSVVGHTDRGVLTSCAEGVTLKPGDGVVFDEGHPEQDEQGGRVYEVHPQPFRGQRGRQRVVELVFARGAVNLASVPLGALVWRTDDPAIRRRLDRVVRTTERQRRAAVDVVVDAAAGRPLVLTWRDDAGRQVVVSSTEPLAAAERHPLTIALLREQLGRLGDTPLELRSVTLAGGDPAPSPVMAPKSVLNQLRRQAVEALLGQRAAATRHEVAPGDHVAAERQRISARWPSEARDATVRLRVLVRGMDQLRTALAWRGPSSLPRLDAVYCEFEDVRHYPDAIAAGRRAEVPVIPATTRIIKPAEEGLLRQIAASKPPAVLVRNLAGLSFFREQFPDLPLVGDYSLNVANELTAAWLLEQGLMRLTPSYDLNWRQMRAMLGRISPAVFEVVLHQHMPMFHTEHCVFAATLSEGRDHRTCGRPCERHTVSLTDHLGVEHPLLADVGCRNTVYNGQAQSGADYVPDMLAAGLRDFRVEVLRQSARELGALLDGYSHLVLGMAAVRPVVRSLRVLSQLGVTAGTLDHD